MAKKKGKANAKRDALHRRLGRKKLEEITTPLLTQAAVVEPPECAALRVWLANEKLKGKFRTEWPQEVKAAEYWRLQVPIELFVLAGYFDRIILTRRIPITPHPASRT